MYVGQSVDVKNRLSHHFCLTVTGCQKLKRAIRKYGKQNFYWGVIRECSSQEETNVFERYYIYKFDAINNGYNILEGGQNGYRNPCSDQTKIKISKSNKGRKRSEQFCKFISKIKTGKKTKPHTKETIEKMKLKKIGYKPWNTGKKGVYSSDYLEHMHNVMKGNKNGGKVFVFISPENLKYEVIGECKKFCEENDLSYEIMRTIYRGRRKNKFHKGWTVERK